MGQCLKKMSMESDSVLRKEYSWRAWDDWAGEDGGMEDKYGRKTMMTVRNSVPPRSRAD